MSSRYGAGQLTLLAGLLALGATFGVQAQDADSYGATDTSATSADDASAVDSSSDSDGSSDAAGATDNADSTTETIAVQPLADEPVADAEPIADKKDTTKLEAIEVTGSRIKRTDYETAAPVLVLTRKDIERSGMTSVGDLLQNLPQAGAALNTAYNNGGDGATEIDLRNLGSNRVLVLVNGRRWVGGMSQLRTSSVDLNTIPISIIESIEVLKDGASAVYGSDAIAGVVNIKTRKDFDGAEVRGQAQVFDDGKGLTQSYSYAAGSFNGTTGTFLDISYVNQGQLFAGDRTVSSVPTFGTGTSRGSSFTPGGRLLFVPTPTNGNVISQGDTSPTAACYDLAGGIAADAVNDPLGTVDPFGTAGVPNPAGGYPTPPSSPLAGAVSNLPAGSPLTICDLALTGLQGGTYTYHRFDQNTDSYNYAPINYLLTPSERIGIYGQMSHQFDNDVHFSSEVLYNSRKSAQQLAPTPLAVGDALPKPFALGYVASDNIYNPTNPNSIYYIPGTQAQDIGLADQAAGLIGLGAVLRRMVELGPRQFQQDVDTMRIGGGFDGQLPLLSDMILNWEGGAAYSENKLQTTEAGLVNMARLARAVGPAANCTGDPNTGAIPPDAAGCVPFDFFGGPGTINQDMLNYVAYTAHDTARQQQKLFYGNLSTEIPVGNFLPHSIGLATGVEFRTESFHSVPDPLKVEGISSTNAASPTNGSYNALEAFGELAIPLVSDVFLVDGLDLSLAARFSDYGDIGNNVSAKYGLEWRVVNGLLLRGTYSEAFRAPSITELYLGAVTSFPETTDPCASPEANDPASSSYNQNTADNCAADGAATSQTNGQIPTIYGGNPDLKPETATSRTAGLVFSPEFLPGFDMSVDWYRISLEDAISVVGADQVFDLCYRSSPNDRSLCDHVERSSNGELSKIDATFANLSALTVEGIDFTINWKIDSDFLAPIGNFKATVDGAYVTKYEQAVPTVGGEAKYNLTGLELGGQGAIPRFKAKAELIWDRGPWEASWATRFISQVFEVCSDPYEDPGAANGGGNPTPVLSLDQYGLCSGPVHPTYGLLNKLEATLYHDVQLSYEMPVWKTKMVLGVINVLNTEPPHAYSAFASTFDPSTYDVPGSRTPYLRFVTNF